MCVRNRIPNSLCGDGVLITHFRRVFLGSRNPQELLGKMFCCAGSHLGRSLISMCRKSTLWGEFCFYSLFFKDHQWFLNSDLLSSMACSESWRIMKNKQRAHTGAPHKRKGRKKFNFYIENKLGRMKSSSLSANCSCVSEVICLLWHREKTDVPSFPAHCGSHSYSHDNNIGGNELQWATVISSNYKKQANKRSIHGIVYF